MVRYEQYAEYKDSGVEWLGEVPHEWNVVKLSYKMKLASGDTLTANDIEPIGQYAVYGGNGLRGYTKDYNCDGSYILIGRQGALCGNINLAKGKFFATEHAVVVYPYEEFNITFLSGFLEFMDLGQYSVSAAQPGLSVDRINALHILVPPINEQIIIGEFLDHETAQIDTLIDKQQTLIQLLKEKRQAVISHAVTKGLNPDALMKDSGVEWLGDVPEHWEVGRLKNVLRIRNGRDYKEVEVESGGYPVYGSGGIFKRSSDYLFDGESVLFGRKGTVDKPLLVSGKFWTVDTMFYSEVFSNAKPNYIYHQALLFPFDQLSTNTALPSMTQENLLELGFVIPPFDEQEQICQYLSNKLKVFSNLVSKAEQAIQLMQERRTALISAAVTGKIDVRDWRAVDNKAFVMHN